MVIDKLLIFGLLFFGESVGDHCETWAKGNLDSLPQSEFIAVLTDSCRYDKYALPTISKPLDIGVEIIIDQLQASQPEFTSHLTMRYTYKDENLYFADKSNRSSILGGAFLKKKIWTPKILMKDDDATTVIDTQQKDIVIIISNNGTVSYSYKLIVRFYCYLNLKKFPFDVQQCTLSFTDWSYSKDNLVLTLKKFKIADKLQFTEFVLDSYSYFVGENTGFYASVDVSDETFIEMSFTLKFHRDVGYYMLIFFLPSYLLVFTAWVTFWLQADAGPPRAILGTSTVVAFITLHLGLAKDIPKVSYIKASDVWFLGISLFIFTSLVEFAFVNVVWRRKKTVELKKVNNKYILKSAIMPRLARKALRKYESQQSVWSINSCPSYASGLDQTETFCNGNYIDMDWEPSGKLKHVHSDVTLAQDEILGPWKTMTPQEVAIWIDRKARIVFPCIFLIFNIFYWTFVYAL